MLTLNLCFWGAKGFKTGVCVNSPDFPGTEFVDQASLEHTIELT